MDIESLKKYFEPEKSIMNPIKLLVPALIIMLIGFGSKPTIAIIGLLGVLAAGLWIYKIKTEKRMTDAEVQAVIDAAGAPAKEIAFDRLGLVEEQLIADPVILVGPSFKGASKKGLDDEWRFSRNEANVLLFSERSVHLYTHRFDILDPDYKSGSTEEYFYRHIVSVSTTETDISIGVGTDKVTVTQDVLLLRNAGGEPIQLSAYNNDKLRQAVSSARAIINERQE